MIKYKLVALFQETRVKLFIILRKTTLKL